MKGLDCYPNPCKFNLYFVIKKEVFLSVSAAIIFYEGSRFIDSVLLALKTGVQQAGAGATQINGGVAQLVDGIGTLKATVTGSAA